jgi:hypothetical protein
LIGHPDIVKFLPCPLWLGLLLVWKRKMEKEIGWMGFPFT